MKRFQLSFFVSMVVLLLGVSGCKQEKPSAEFTAAPTSGAAPLNV